MAEHDRVLVDTAAFYALHSENDRFHAQARVVYERLSGREHELWTTSYALVETIALMERRQGFHAVVQFVDWLEGNGLQVLWIDNHIHEETWRRYVTQSERHLGFVDCATAIASARLGAPIFTFDAGFAQSGLSVLPRL